MEIQVEVIIMPIVKIMMECWREYNDRTVRLIGKDTPDIIDK